MKHYILGLLALITCFSLTACSGSGVTTGTDNTPKELNLLTWEGYVPADVVQKFEEETGIKINYSAANDNESMIAKIQADKSAFDIIILSDYVIPTMISEGLIGELDRTKLPNFGNIDPAFQGQACDPDNKYTIPYTASAAIIAYDSAALDFVPVGYEDFWRPELKNSVVLLDGDRDVIGFTLQTLGYSVNDTDPAHLAEAQAKLLELKPNVIGFDANTPHNMLISGEAKIGYMFGSQVTEAMAQKDTIDFVYPEEGLGSYIDNVVMAAEAPNAENAYTFLNFILDGENSAAISNAIFYTNCNTAAKEFLSEDFKNNATINIPQEFAAKMESYGDLGEARSLYTDVWTVFKSN
ncbi:MAG: spermidine/putrescine ABC transporter substrate-binding protein [Clostridiales bacterium]|nr:spermidine/putrescine ABC transporter substrate-binding protein [Clostridiales bacterium]